jgi:hypothetical protein
MGTQVLAALRSDTKPNYVLSTVAAGSVVSADGNFYMFVGSTAATQLNAKTGQRMCMQALREADWPDPATTEAAWASYETVTNTLATGSGVDPTLTENMVAIIKASGFSPAGVSASTHSKRTFELILEVVLKVA